VLQATKKGFVRVKDLSETNGIFHCAPGDVHRMKSRSGDGMTLQDVGESMSDFK
jgi:hypothetical protein